MEKHCECGAFVAAPQKICARCEYLDGPEDRHNKTRLIIFALRERGGVATLPELARATRTPSRSALRILQRLQLRRRVSKRYDTAARCTAPWRRDKFDTTTPRVSVYALIDRDLHA